MLINLVDATINIEEREILQNVNFSASENDFIYIVGKVGSGKSSLLKSLYGELPIKGTATQILEYDLSLTRLFLEIAVAPTPSIKGVLGITLTTGQSQPSVDVI